ncbi:PREDICTED: alpha-amylase-like [Ipomoea nil]|uniref:alpha-amylase-like n=1 Tax=Ipomoea nil TaxID=35883 RepID=UPI0009015227|nr:PREDICTED: alpha-amylase-like [Ipomoea nil]
MKSSFYLSLFCIAFFLFPLHSSSTVLFQGFTWTSKDQPGGWWNWLITKVPDLADAGITHVWLPPPSNAREGDDQGYMPKRMYDLDTSKYGNKKELKALNDAFHGRGIKSVADIVLNHRAAERANSRGVFNVFEGGTPDDKLDWGPSEICGDDAAFEGTGNPDTGDPWGDAPDIDHRSPRVQREISEWMNWLKSDVGFDGWRFDYVKGYDFVKGFAAVKIYMDNTKPEFAVGELWNALSPGSVPNPDYNQDAHRNELVRWVQNAGGAATAFDFTTKGILQAALNNTELWRLKDAAGKPSGMIGVLPQSAVTFIDNHDTWSQRLWPFTTSTDDAVNHDRVLQGYAYILTHPGIPSVFYDHFFEWGLKDAISKLISIRNKNGVSATSPVEILAADADLYIAKINGKVILKIGPNGDLKNLVPSDFMLATSGKDFAVWEKPT